jgi:hypothetical protein
MKDLDHPGDFIVGAIIGNYRVSKVEALGNVYVYCLNSEVQTPPIAVVIELQHRDNFGVQEWKNIIKAVLRTAANGDLKCERPFCQPLKRLVQGEGFTLMAPCRTCPEKEPKAYAFSCGDDGEAAMKKTMHAHPVEA